MSRSQAILAADATGIAGHPVSPCEEPAGKQPKERPRASLSRSSPWLIVIAVLLADATRLADNDLWRHVHAGLLILRSDHVPRVDVDSFTMANHPWFDHEWLSEVLLALSFKTLGVVGLKLFKLTLSATTVAMLAVALYESGATPAQQCVILLFVAVGIHGFVEFRPQITTYAMFAGLMALIVRDKRKGDASLGLLVPMFALWANLHGAFLAGLAAFGIYVCASTVIAIADGDARRCGYLWLYLGLGAAATLVNPYGIAAWITPLHSLASSDAHAAIDEWLPFASWLLDQWQLSPTGAIVYASLFALLPAALLGCWLTSPDRDELPMLAITIPFFLLAVHGYRHIPIALIVTAVALASHLGSVRRRQAFARREVIDKAGADRGPALKSVLMAGICVLLAIETGLFAKRLNAKDVYPSGAMAFMKARGLSGNVLCGYDWSGYVIWHGVNDKVFVDTRFETVFPHQVLHDFLALTTNAKGSTNALTNYPTQYVLVRRQGPAASAMKTAADWKPLYEDTVAILFAKQSRETALPLTIKGEGAATPQLASSFP